jgi:hypothetical protein
VPTADETRLLSNRFDMLPIANAAWRRQGQHGFIDRGSPSPLASSWIRKCRFGRITYRLGLDAGQARLEGLFNMFGVI